MVFSRYGKTCEIDTTFSVFQASLEEGYRSVTRKS